MAKWFLAGFTIFATTNSFLLEIHCQQLNHLADVGNSQIQIFIPIFIFGECKQGTLETDFGCFWIIEIKPYFVMLHGIQFKSHIQSTFIAVDGDLHIGFDQYTMIEATTQMETPGLAIINTTSFQTIGTYRMQRTTGFINLVFTHIIQLAS